MLSGDTLDRKKFAHVNELTFSMSGFQEEVGVTWVKTLRNLSALV